MDGGASGTLPPYSNIRADRTPEIDTSDRRMMRWWAAAAGVALVLGGVALGQPVVPTTNASCPTGQVADDEDSDFNCQPDCPDGMLVDAVTGTCVAAPGVPPPPLGGGEPRTAVG